MACASRSRLPRCKVFLPCEADPISKLPRLSEDPLFRGWKLIHRFVGCVVLRRSGHTVTVTSIEDRIESLGAGLWSSGMEILFDCFVPPVVLKLSKVPMCRAAGKCFAHG